MRYLLAALVGYLVGCSNMAYYIAQLRKVDLRGGGSGNLGASNATILLGWKSGIVVGVHDIGKAFLAVVLVRWLFRNDPNVGALAGVSCVLGHIFPFWLKFRGGKGFASYLGMPLALNWKLALVILALVVIVTWITDYIVCGTFTTIAVVPVGMGILTHSWVLALILMVGTLVILFKHRENIPRMLKGTEIGLRSTIRGENKVK